MCKAWEEVNLYYRQNHKGDLKMAKKSKTCKIANPAGKLHQLSWTLVKLSTSIMGFTKRFNARTAAKLV